MIYKFQGRKFARDGSTPTPAKVSEFLRLILKSALQPKVVLDPCCGTGSLIAPWWNDAYLIGVDHGGFSPMVDEYHDYPFHLYTSWDHRRPELVICNPPYCAATTAMMWPERFLRTITELFGNDIPVALFAPHGFRLNQSWHSSRRNWLKEGPKITSIVSLPVDTFPSVKFHTEILIFNIRGLEPHYWP